MAILDKIIRNDAMRNDPKEIYGWRVWVLATAACFGGMLFGWDIGAIGGIMVMPSFKAKFGLADKSSSEVATLVSNIVSVLQAGCFVGSLVAYWVADRWGRKPSLLGSAFISIVGIVIQTSSSGHIAALYVGRFIAGLGVGAASMLTPLYVSENAPRSIRGALTGMYQLNITIGIMMSFWVNYGSLKHSVGDTQWEVPLATQMLAGVFMFVGVSLCNESPRYLAKQDNWEKATDTLVKIRNLPADHPYVRMELEDMAEQLESERRIIGGSSFMDLQREMWTIPSNRKRGLISIGLFICQQMTGVNAINYYAPTIFEGLGIVGTSNGLFATGVYGIVKVVTCAFFVVFCADSLGRRLSLLWTAIAQGIFMFIIGIYVRTNPPIEGAPIPPFGYVALVCIFLFVAAFEVGWGPACWIIVSEIPTARLRAMNVALAAATQWLFNFVVAQAVPHMLVSAGKNGYGTYFIFGSFSFAMFFFTWFLIPETKGVSLEKMNELFGEVPSSKMEGEEAQIGHANTKHAGSETISNEGRSEKALDSTHVETK
ncbi:putative quinate permease [Calycina marina]|uniref:Quinate permease n=1 Tax=Calycina marina TaxID=1763456 RepID=A0A9P7YWI8_9HELO|nr:putative quinate permease [Calycina marina]